MKHLPDDLFEKSQRIVIYVLLSHGRKDHNHAVKEDFENKI
jgi:hypothetical protein